MMQNKEKLHGCLHFYNLKGETSPSYGRRQCVNEGPGGRNDSCYIVTDFG